MPIGEILTRSVRRYPHKCAVVAGTSRYTYSEFNQRVNRLAHGWLGWGLHPGERIAVLADNCPEYLEIYLAGAKSGLVIVPLSPRLAPAEIVYIINNSQANTLVITTSYLGLLSQLRSQLPGVSRFLAIGGQAEGVMSYQELVSGQPDSEPAVEMKEGDLFAIAYTSGTTGLPKGVMHTHQNVTFTIPEGVIMFGVAHQDIVLLVLPFFHVAFPWWAMVNLYVGATVVCAQSFAPQWILDTIAQEKITTLQTAVPVVSSLLEVPHISQYPLSSLRWIAYAGAPLPLATLDKARGLLGDRLINYYALTEISGPVAMLPAVEAARRPGSCGRETINSEIRLVNDQGQEVGAGELGEVIVKSGGLMKGYWGLPQLTTETVRGGYLFTGDLATRDEEGYLYIAGRKKDMICLGEHRFHPQEVEEVLYHHPAISEAAVVDVPPDILKAVVVLKEAKMATEAEIAEFCRRNLPEYAVPGVVEFTSRLPRNPMGKVLRRLLREPGQI